MYIVYPSTDLYNTVANCHIQSEAIFLARVQQYIIRVILLQTLNIAGS